MWLPLNANLRVGQQLIEFWRKVEVETFTYVNLRGKLYCDEILVNQVVLFCFAIAINFCSSATIIIYFSLVGRKSPVLKEIWVVSQCKLTYLLLCLWLGFFYIVDVVVNNAGWVFLFSFWVEWCTCEVFGFVKSGYSSL